MTCSHKLCGLVLIGMSFITAVQADEGMWLLSRPPVEFLKSKYGFEPTPAWLEHVQKSAVKMGASGSFVSADGLLMTNHHVASGQIHKHSTAARDLMKNGFLARTRAEEIPCEDMEVQVLWDIADVTEQVNAAAGPELSAAEAYTARRARMTEIEKEAGDKSGLDCEVVTLYNGGRYHLYSYKRYTDVRLVFAPEKSTAFFGGDNDNFEYPRFDLDASFFRVYENGQPLKPAHYFRWSKQGAADGELTFVAGHPGRTRRFQTVDHLAFLRDTDLPNTLDQLRRREVQLNTFYNRNAENARISEGDLFGTQNSRKARWGVYTGLLDPQIIKTKVEAENALRATLPDGENDPWLAIAEAQDTYRDMYLRYLALQGAGNRLLQSDLYGIAVRLVQLADELPKPSKDRFREYRDTELDTVYRSLYSPAPIYDALEIESISNGIAASAELFGGEDLLTLVLSDGIDPRDRAVQLVSGTKLRDVAVRRKLAEGGKAAILASEDPMIKLALILDEPYRTLRKRYEDEVEGVERISYAKIAALRFARDGENQYPDATGTLRLAFGPVLGYEEGGRKVPPFTTFRGLFERFAERQGRAIETSEPGAREAASSGRDKLTAVDASSGGAAGATQTFPAGPFDLPQRWLTRKKDLNLDTPYNFVTTADIIGGNSGSPVINKSGEIVGLIFDGNLQSLIWDIAYTDKQGRAVAVDSRAIIEALRKIYDANELADELTK